MTTFTPLSEDAECPACHAPTWRHTRAELDECSREYGVDVQAVAQGRVL